MVWTIIVGYPLYFYTLYACVVATTSWDNVRLMTYYLFRDSGICYGMLGPLYFDFLFFSSIFLDFFLFLVNKEACHTM